MGINALTFVVALSCRRCFPKTGSFEWLPYIIRSYYLDVKLYKFVQLCECVNVYSLHLHDF